MIKPTKEVSFLDMSNGTVLELQVFKQHAGKIQVIAVSPSGDYKWLFDWNLNAQPLIDQNKQNDQLAPHPHDWPTNHHLEALKTPSIGVIRTPFRQVVK